ncbi:MAG: hypothetical protein GWP15_04230 [Nitrospirae bacterium]|nr:hypothetical protein [Nitrospirota bacterium]
MIIELVGYSAAILTASTMTPQIIKSIRTRQVEDVSMAMVTMYTINTGLWVTYGLLIGATPIVLADGLACCAGITQFILKLKYEKSCK